MSFVSEPLFLLAAAIVLVAVVVPVLLAPRGGFTYAVLYDGLFEIPAEPKGEDGPDEEAAGERVRVVAVELKNSSGRHIERSHYARPISVGFGEGARIVGAEVIGEDPPGIEASLRGLPERDPERVALAPVLLNDGDVVLLELVVGGIITGEIEADGRILGIKRIAEQRGGAVGKTTLAVANGVVAVLALALGSLYQVLVLSGGLDIDFLNPSILNLIAGVLTGLAVGDLVLLLRMYWRWHRTRAVRRRVLARHSAASDGVR